MARRSSTIMDLRGTLDFIFLLFALTSCINVNATLRGSNVRSQKSVSASSQSLEKIPMIYVDGEYISDSVLMQLGVVVNGTNKNNSTKDLKSSGLVVNVGNGLDDMHETFENIADLFQSSGNESEKNRILSNYRRFSYIIPEEIVSQTFRKAEDRWLRRMRKIESIWINNAGADSKSPIGTAFAFNAPNSDSLALSNTSVLLEMASRAFLTSLKLPAEDGTTRAKRQTVRFVDTDFRSNRGNDFIAENSNTLGDVSPFLQIKRLSGTCGLSDDQGPCDASVFHYRSYSGYCNNLRNPNLGKSVTVFDRMLPPVYNDGVSTPRSKSVLGGPLPSPRYISSTVHIDVSHLSNKHTLMFMQYAQFLDHDITLTPVHKGPGDKILNCRDCNSQKHVHPECWPVPVPSSDSYYPVRNQTNGNRYCIPFTRSLPGQQVLGPRQQINQNSAYLDSSQIYGETICKANSLRSPGGKLNVTRHPVHGGKALLPQITFLRECKSSSGYCFYAGDARASEQPALAVVHTVFLRQHNDWADQLHSINPHWDDDKIYQEVRRIMGAVNQHIAYNELIPRILGPTMVNNYGLGLQTEGYYAGYDPNCSPNAFNEFATAAFRFGHSLIRPQLSRMDARYKSRAPYMQLREGFFNSDMLYEPLMVDELIRGLLAEPMEQLDPFVTNEITNHLFEDKKRAFSGMDLISLNLHRARDHGIQGYNQYRGICNLRKAHHFSDLEGEIPIDVIARLEKAYQHVDDIDLFTGSLVERPVPGGLLGPVMSCIIGSQFKRLRQCDRYWYETNDPLLRFKPQQLAEIRKMTLSKIICANLDLQSEIQKSAFDAPHSFLNPRIPCERLPTLNLEAWRENYATPPHAPAIQTPNTYTIAPHAPAIQTPKECNIGGRLVHVGGANLPSPCVSCICTPEGTKCASLKITSCNRLFIEATQEDISRDQVCMAQCGFMMSSTPKAQHSKHIPSRLNKKISNTFFHI